MTVMATMLPSRMMIRDLSVVLRPMSPCSAHSFLSLVITGTEVDLLLETISAPEVRQDCASNGSNGFGKQYLETSKDMPSCPGDYLVFIMSGSDDFRLVGGLQVDFTMTLQKCTGMKSEWAVD